MKKLGILQNSYGHNLIEVMIAAGIIGGIGLLSSDYIVNSIKSSQQIQDSAECQNAISAIASKIKEDDNLRSVQDWTPTSLAQAQSTNHSRRFWETLVATN